MTEDNGTSLMGHSLIWFGAAISLAEILTGTLFAPLGFWKAFAAITIGHLLGCLLLYCSGVICARNREGAMDCTKRTFGPGGGKIFAGFNVLQLIGWTSVMISIGAQTANAIFQFSCGNWCWSLLIGLLILIWLNLRFGILEKANLITMVLLLILSLLLSKNIIATTNLKACTGKLSFGEALELSIAMPVSWLPLIGDYTCKSTRPRLVSLISVIVYFLASCWMYVIGLCAVICLGETDITRIMVHAGVGIMAMLIVILSTVTTTFLDVYSAGISIKSAFPRMDARVAADIVCLLGILFAIICDTSIFEAFLYWIGSIFVPMAVVQICDVFIFHSNHTALHNSMLWLAGFIIYRLFLHFNLPCGSTIPDIALTACLCLVFKKRKQTM